MVNKCAVFGCKRGYESEEPQHEDYHAFYFPLDERKSHLLPAWEKFVCRDGWKPSANSVICEFHFEDCLIRKGKRWTLKWKLNPMPTMLTDEMKAMPQSVQPTPAAPPRKPPAKCTCQEDEIDAFLSQDIIGDFSELNSTHAPPGFQCAKSDNSIVFFNLTYFDGFPVIFESIKVDQSLHVQLQFNGHPVPLPVWFTKGRNATLTRFSQLNNFPNAIRVVSQETECSRSLLNEMLDISNYQAKGRPPYSSAMIRFALHLRYTSLQTYKLLLEKFPLPSIFTLHRIQAGGVEDSLKAAKKLPEKGHISSDVILIVDEMFLQKEAYALVLTLRAQSGLIKELLFEGYDFVMTSRLQSDPIERRFSQYRQMSCGRFLVSLREVTNSERIIRCRSLVKADINFWKEDLGSDKPSLDFSALLALLSEHEIEIAESTLDSSSEEVSTTIAGYIAKKLAKRSNCDSCKSLLIASSMDLAENHYLNLLSRGGLIVPSAKLAEYTSHCFAIMDYSYNIVQAHGIRDVQAAYTQMTFVVQNITIGD